MLGATTVVSRASVEAWAGSATTPGGIEVGIARVGRAVDVGTSAPFSITIPPGRFQLNRAFGIIPVAVQVRDTASSTNEITHTFVGWQRTKQYEPVRLGVVAPVTLSPSAALFDTDPATRLAAWKAELDPGSRINRILDGTDVDGPAGPVPVTWASIPASSPPTARPARQPGSGGHPETDLSCPSSHRS